MMHILARMMPSRMVFAILAAAVVFLLTNGTLGGYDGASFALNGPTAPADPGKPLEGGTPSEGDLKTSGPNGQLRRCADIEEARGGFLLGRIVPCLTNTIEHSASRMSRAMIELLRPTLYAFLTFVIIIFGVQILQNEGQLQTRAFVLLLKIGFCFAILAAIPGDKNTEEGGLIGAAYGIMAESQAAVMSTIGPDFGNIHCEIEKFGDAKTPLIWKQMDCLLSKLAGFTVGTPGGPGQEARPNMLLASSIIGLMGGFFFSGSFGVALFFACIGMLVSMFVLVIRVLVAFLNSYMFIALYMILAPLLLPMMFLKVTNSMFEKWYSGIIASLLLPLVICGYVVIALQVYDKLFFADDAMITKLFDNQIMDHVRQLPQALCDTTISNNPDFRKDATGEEAQSIYTDNPMFQNINPLVSAGNNICGGLSKTNLDFQGLTDEKGQPITAKKAFEKLFYDCMKLFILSMLINMGFNTVMSAVRPMLGSGAVVAAMDSGTPLEGKFRSAMSQSKQAFGDRLGNTSGPGFLKEVPGAFGDSANAFLSGMGAAPRSAPKAPPAAPSGGGSSAGSGGDGPDTPASGGTGGSGAGGSGGSTPRAAGASAPSTASKPGVRTASVTDRREAAEAVLNKTDLQRFDELEQTIARGGLPADKMKELNEEFERLLDQIDQGSGG